MAILKSIKSNTKTVSFRLPTVVADELEAVKAEAKQRGLALDLTEQAERMIASACRQARAELDDTAAAGNQ